MQSQNIDTQVIYRSDTGVKRDEKITMDEIKLSEQ